MLGLMTFNTLFFMFMYIILKFCYGEQVTLETSIYMILAVCTWIPALYFFSEKHYNHQESPANSRNNNEPCVIAFYDEHDVWHFCSALGLFFNLMLLLTLDDNFKEIPRGQIKDFRQGTGELRICCKTSKAV